MKSSAYISLVSFVLLIINSSYSQCNERELSRIYLTQDYIDHYTLPTDWQLVFEDQFDGNEVNNTFWYTNYGYGPTLNDDAVVYCHENNLKVENGKLLLSIKHKPGEYGIWKWDEEGNFYTEPKHFNYTSGSISSKEAYQCGLFEIRCKLPENLNDINSSFWLLGDCTQEIDVFEWLRPEPNKLTMSYIGMPNARNRTCNVNDRCVDASDITRNYTGQWHTYSLEWNPFWLIWRIDGGIVRMVLSYRDLSTKIPVIPSIEYTYWRDDVFPYTNIPMRIMLGLGEVNTEPFNNQTLPDVPRTMEVDYVKVYKQKHCTQSSDVCDNFKVTALDAFRLGSYVTIAKDPNCNFSLTKDSYSPQGGSFTHIYYDNYAEIYNNTEIQKGAFFEVLPMECNESKSGGPVKADQSMISEQSTFDASSLIKVYPNPFQDILNIQSSKEINNIKIYDSHLIQKISAEFNNEKSVLIDLKHLPKGVYLMKIIYSDKMSEYEKILHN